MARLCERPGCSQPADVLYGIDADHLLVWIEGLDGAVMPRAGVLCRRHADAMVVPLGWMLDDRREPVPRLFKPRDPTPPPPARPRRHRSSAHRGDDTGQLELAATDETLSVLPAVAGAHAAPDSATDDPGTDGADAPGDHDAGLPWKPVFDQRDDLGGLLMASSPLLARAFGKRNPPPAD